MTNLNTTHKSKDSFRLYHIVENDFATTVTTKWKLDVSFGSAPTFILIMIIPF